MITNRIPLPLLSDELIQLRPLVWEDFEPLRLKASDPKIWEQHPKKERATLQGFKTFFEGAIDSRCTYAIYHLEDKCLIGMSSFYDYDDYHDIIVIGYTFIARAYWGLGINGRVKTMMMEYAFDKLGVKHVLFHVDENNIRSQKALEKIGIKKSNHDLWVKDHENDRHNLVFVKSTVAK